MADLVETLSPAQLSTRSLCTAWTVHQVAGHLLMPLVTPMPRVLVSLAAHRFNFDRANIALSTAVARRPVHEIVAGLRDNAESRFHPPRLGFEAPLTDLLVHQQDIRRPLDLGHDQLLYHLVECLDYLHARATGHPADRNPYAGVRLVAEDIDWTAGEGPEVIAHGEALLLLLSGRLVVLDELTGPGVDQVRSRLSG